MSDNPKIIVNNDYSKTYNIKDKICDSQFTTLHKAQCENDKRIYCLKEVRKYGINKSQNKYFTQEYNNCRQLQSFNVNEVIKIYDIITCQDKYYIVMDYFERNLQDYIESYFDQIGLKKKIDYCIQIGNGLRKFHSEGLTHRDIKPQNILVNNGQNGQINLKITDVGISTFNEIMESRVGTLSYVAPEILNEQKALYSNRVDIFSFGCLIYFIMTNKTLIDFNDKNYISVKQYKAIQLPDKQLFDSINNLIFHCIQIDPDKRPDIKQILGLLKQIKDYVDKYFQEKQMNESTMEYSIIYE